MNEPYAGRLFTFTLLVCALVPVLGLVQAQAAPVTPANAVDHVYFAGGEAIQLYEVPGEVVVAGKTDRRGNVTEPPLASYGLDARGRPVGAGLAIYKQAPNSRLHADTAARSLVDAQVVRFAWPVLRAEPFGPRLVPGDEVLVEFSAKLTESQRDAIAAEYGTVVARQLRGEATQYVLRIVHPARQHPVPTANALREHPDVNWAEPNFYAEIETQILANDPLVELQWHLQNTGQQNGTPGADVHILSAWELATGSNDTVVAVLDNGVQRTHPDLAAAIYANTADPIDGKDNDGNGYVDDHYGWDFVANDNDPSPDSSADRHGTPVAGVIAALANNARGGAGLAPGVQVLPIRIASGMTGFVSNEAIAEAIRYAADHADVLSNSWVGGGRSEAIVSAINYARLLGRDGRGCPVLFAAGNEGGGWQRVRIPVDAGRHTYRWEYTKDYSGAVGDDTVWVDDVTFPDGEREDFNGMAPPAKPNGWLGLGNEAWKTVSDPVRSRGGSGASLRAGSIGDDEKSVVEVVHEAGAGVITFYVWVSTEANYDMFRFRVDGEERYTLSGGGLTEGVAPPASWPETIAVGASTNFDERAPYSQYGPALDLVAPSDGGTVGIWTTDMTGADGYSADDYCEFGGTSAACPVVAGCVGLLLSHNPELTEEEVRLLLQDSCDKVGPYPYDANGRNDFYGYGRINAETLLSVEAIAPVTVDADEDGLDDRMESDTPGEGQANVLLADSDGDGLPDGAEDVNGNGVQDEGETAVRLADSDGDGWEDGLEVNVLRSDPTDAASPGALADADGDGLPVTLDTDDTNPDVDGDRYADGYEAVHAGLAAVRNPAVHPSLGDVNGDGDLTNLDSLLVHCRFLGQETGIDLQLPAADINRDGHFSNQDSLALQQFFLADDTVLP